MMDMLLSVAAALVVVMSLIDLCLMAVDKHKAKAEKRRIPEKTLFLFAILLGAIGGSIGMWAFRHKTQHWYFAVFFPLLAALQLAGLVVLAGVVA